MSKYYSAKQIITGISFIAFPLLFITGNVMHTDLLDFKIHNNASEWINEIHGNTIQQYGNLLEYLSAPFLIVMIFSLINTIKDKYWHWGLTGGIMALAGVATMIVSKGAYCLSVSGIDTLPENEFQQLSPAFEALFSKSGLLKVTMAIPLLPIGFLMMSIGLLKGRYLNMRHSIFLLTGSLVLINPGIEFLNLIGAIILSAGLIPLAIELINNKVKQNLEPF